MAGAHQVGARILAGAHQIAGTLIGSGGHRHRDKLPRPQHACQALGVTPIVLYPLAARARDPTRGGHQARDARALERARKAIARGPGLVGRAHRAG